MPRITKKPQITDSQAPGELDGSERIVEVVQTGTVTHIFEATGSPQEAMISGVFDGKQIANGHEWFRNSHVAERRFESMVPSSDPAKRRTKVTIVYKRGTCPTDATVQIVAQTKPSQTWWSFDDPPKLMVATEQGLVVPRPMPMLIIHVPLVRLSLQTLLSIARLVGHTNKESFLQEAPDYWLFEDLRVRQLWGSVSLFTEEGPPEPPGSGESNLPAWETTFFFRADFFQHHKRFAMDFDALKIPRRPAGNSFEERAQAHVVTTLLPQADFSDFVLLDREACKTIHDDQ